MPIHILLTFECDVCGGPMDTYDAGDFVNTNITKVITKIEKTITKVEKKEKAKIAQSTGRCICKDCRPIANKSPRWSKG